MAMIRYAVYEAAVLFSMAAGGNYATVAKAP